MNFVRMLFFRADGKMNEEILNDIAIKRRLILSFMDLIILHTLSSHKQGIGGYDIIRHLHLDYNILLSPGTVYSCLYTLERKGLIKGRQNGRKRIYNITQHGEKTIRALQATKNKIGTLISMLLYGTRR